MYICVIYDVIHVFTNHRNWKGFVFVIETRKVIIMEKNARVT